MNIGDKIPAYLQLFDCNTSKFVRAFVRDATGAQIPSSPVNLSPVALGLYGDNSLVYPNSPFVTVQYVVYSDSGYSSIDPTEGATMEMFFLGSGLTAGAALPIAIQLYDCDSGKFPVATVRDVNGNQIAGSPVSMAHVANGLYVASGLVMPISSTFVTVQVVVYDDSGHTQISANEGSTSYTLALSGSSGASGALSFPVIGFLDNPDLVWPTAQLPVPQDAFVVGSVYTLGTRLCKTTTYEPVDLSAFTGTLEARFLNADGSTLSVLSTDGGNPVQIVSALTGKMSVALTSAQTALLMAQNPAPFTLVLADSSESKTIFNFPNQLAVINQEV
jgi:hypothetical protein